MWSAFINGSGLNAGGGSGGGYVPAQGWEFVPCSRMERAHKGRGKSRSPLRRISSPPTVFSQIYEPQFGASPAGEEGGVGTQFEILRGQMWPGAEPQQQQQQQTQHTRLKKKFDDLKKRHIQDKEEWMREKECLLREVADIQGGENRRILLDLKTVLEEVQAEVKREEEKRSELQLQYTRDRCAWELEKAELKCRIAQLEAREANGLLSGGVQSAAGPGLVASHGPREQHCETSTIRREREEQRRILADTHSTAMDLRCRLEHNERDWLREKAELLEKFDVERREWEGQLKDMQRKIEELYSEVRAKHMRPGLSLQSTSTGSSVLSENSSSHSDANRHPPLPDFSHACNVSGNSACGNRDDNCFHPDSLHVFNVSGQFSQNDQTKLELLDELRARSSWQQDTVDTTELDAILHRAPGCGTTQEACKGKDTSVCVTPQERPLWEEISDGSMRKNATALNAALEEIARVSEELCSYQDEIRKKGGDKRNLSESLCLPEESETPFISDKTRLEVDEAPSNLSHIFDDLWVSDRENWVPSSPDNTWRDARGPNEFWTTNTADPESYRDTQTSPGVHPEMDTAAPPIPPRTSSWNLCSPTQPDTELHIPESPMSTVRKCHSPCVLVDRKCNSPSIVRKFEAMLQENEGKVFIDGAVTSCSVAANANCNKGCCHNRWSCDASKFTSSKLSTYDTVQKSFSEVNIRSAGKDPASDCSPGFGCLKRPELETPPVVRELPVNLLSSPLEIPPASPNLQGSRRNIMLEQKTAEFNRTLFQAEMGRGVEEQDNFIVTDACSVDYQTSISASDEVLSPKETFQPHCTDVTTSAMRTHSEVTLSLSILDSTIQNPKPLEVSKDKETSSVFSPDRPQAELREATVAPQNPVHHSAVKHKVRTPSSPSRKTQHRAATEASFPEPALPVDDSSFKKENPHGAKPQPGRAAVLLQQSSTESKQTQMTQPRHVSDSSRPGPRMMNDHPWKPLTLAAYPRPEGSRSNYGAVERILKNYESAARTQQNQSQQIEMPSSFNSSARQEETVAELDMPDMDPPPLPPTLRHTQTSFTSQTLTTHVQLGSSIAIKEMQLVVQENEESPASSSSVQKNFSRPARPANRRLPSRWASRSPTSSSSTSSSSPSTTPVVPPAFPLQKHTSAFTYSHAFHIETVI